MYRSQVVFIIGAGASQDVGLPVGTDLKNLIADKVNFQFNRENVYHRRPLHGDQQIYDVLRDYVKELNKAGQGDGHINPYVDAGRHINAAIPAAISIDSFIDAHRGNRNIELCSKLAIVKCILESEQNSRLRIGESSKGEIALQKLSSSWLIRLAQTLIDECRRDDISAIFEKVSLIVFNYDRCIEHFLFNTLQSYYDIDATEAKKVMMTLRIFHPYGVVGKLPWQDLKNPVPFGAADTQISLLTLAAQIKTYAESVEDGVELNSAREWIEAAEKVVFLGFGFHEPNMRLIHPGQTEKAKQVYLTAKGIPPPALDILERRLKNEFFGLDGPEVVTFVHGDTCASFFDEFSKPLTAR